MNRNRIREAIKGCANDLTLVDNPGYDLHDVSIDEITDAVMRVGPPGDWYNKAFVTDRRGKIRKTLVPFIFEAARCKPEAISEELSKATKAIMGLYKRPTVRMEDLRETVFGAIEGKGHPRGLVGLLHDLGVEVTDES